MRRLSGAHNWIVFVAALVLSLLACALLFSPIEKDPLITWGLFTLFVVGLVIAAVSFYSIKRVQNVLDSRTFKMVLLPILIVLLARNMWSIFQTGDTSVSGFLSLLYAYVIIKLVRDLLADSRKQRG